MRAILSLLVCLTVPAFGQSALPPCNPNVAATSWTNCQGTHDWANGDRYVGEYRDGKRHGQGTYTLANGDRYVGGFRDGNLNGQGTLTHADGDKHVGEYRDGKRHGQGIFTLANGGGYVGEYRDDKPNGQGTSTWPDGNKHVGKYRDGKRHGQGTYTLANGGKYVGEWRDNKRNGQGITTYADGRPPEEGVWEDGKFVRAQRIPDHVAGRSTAQPDRSQQTTGGTVNPLAASPQSNFDLARKKCGDLGLKSGTEKFGECVLRLSK